MQIKVDLDATIKECDCCGKSKLSRALKIEKDGFNTHLGVVCAGKIFQLNLTGNPHKAAAKLEREINTWNQDYVDDLLETLKEM